MSKSKIPQESWPNGFAASKLESLYTSELYWLAHRIEEKCNRLFSKHPKSAPNYYASADTESLDIAFEALSDASRFRELLFPGRGKRIYEERAAYLRDLLQSVDYTALVDKQVRNTLEHFPEYLDDANYIHSEIPPKKLYAVAFNFVFSHLYKISPGDFPFPTYISPLDGITVFPIRVFVASTCTVHNFFWSIDLSVLAAQANSVKTTIASLLGAGRPEDWMSGLIAIGPAGV